MTLQKIGFYSMMLRTELVYIVCVCTEGLSYSNADRACCYFASWIPRRVLLPLFPLSPKYW